MNQTLSILYILIATGVFNGFIYWKGFVRTGYPAWKAFIPIYNIFIQLKIIGRPQWWVILFFSPVINNVMLIILVYEWLHVFGYRKKRYTVFAFLTLGIYLAYINYHPNTKYVGRDDSQIARSLTTWTSAIIYAVVAASIIHIYFLRPFVIPSSSLEKTLLVGDFLFVSKLHYGVQIPMTPLAVPMVHDSLPIFKTRSYIKSVQLPHMRLPGFQKIKRNDIVVFNWPADTVRYFFVKEARVDKPIDKRANYVKRCVGIAGDTLQIKGGDVYINGKYSILPDRAKLQSLHIVKTNAPLTSRSLQEMGRKINEAYPIYSIARSYWDDERVSAAFIQESQGLEIVDRDSSSVYLTGGINQKLFTNFRMQRAPNLYLLNMTEEEASIFKGKYGITEIKRFIYTLPGKMYPQNSNMGWNVDEYGPIYIPKAGSQVPLTIENLPIYKKAIVEYEKKSVEVKGNQIFIDGKPADSYTFQQDYYWMMGDNRHMSEDSRFWGFVPFDHVVGRPVFIFMSIQGLMDGISHWKIRWDRLFTTVGGDGKPISYFPYFIGALILWIGVSTIRSRRKKVKTEDRG